MNHIIIYIDLIHNLLAHLLRNTIVAITAIKIRTESPLTPPAMPAVTPAGILLDGPSTTERILLIYNIWLIGWLIYQTQ